MLRNSAWIQGSAIVCGNVDCLHEWTVTQLFSFLFCRMRLCSTFSFWRKHSQWTLPSGGLMEPQEWQFRYDSLTWYLSQAVCKRTFCFADSGAHMPSSLAFVLASVLRIERAAWAGPCFLFKQLSLMVLSLHLASCLHATIGRTLWRTYQSWCSWMGTELKLSFDFHAETRFFFNIHWGFKLTVMKLA